MPKNYPEYLKLDVADIEKQISAFWDENAIFEKSITNRKDAPNFTFYEGPPSANGLPGIHHVISRAIKDVFCRFQSLKGKKVERKAGWDTHGLPVELQVEKELNISKEDIGKKISIADYNAACKKAVMKYTDVWEQLTRQMGYWVNMDAPYITYNNKYMESVWWLLSQFYKKNLLYKGFTVQPYSPAAGSALSTHELNQPGCYRDVTDTTIVAEFLIEKGQKTKDGIDLSGCYFLAWTTTPWTLPANTALAVGKKITYCLVKTFNKYTGQPQKIILAKDLLQKYFDSKNEKESTETFNFNAKNLEYAVLQEFSGKDLLSLRYKQLFNYAKPDGGDAFKVIAGDYVSTEEGTGIVHIAPSHGADDFRVAKQQNVGAILVVDKQGKFTEEMDEFAGEYVKEDYYNKKELPANFKNVDVRLAIALKERSQAFLVEKYRHSYPHCWRTDKPIIYAPTDSWFIKTTAIKDKLIALNNTIKWKPASTGTGRFGNWIENLVDWNLSRSRFWGVPLPIWRTKDGKEEICIGSVAELAKEIKKSIALGFMKSNPYGTQNFDTLDLHRPFIDDVVLASAKGEKMYRETDIIDVWFESGSMPYAQQHYPFENNNKIDQNTHFPADFIAEGVDQTRGWFFTLHVIAAAIFDSVAYKNVVANGLILDKNGAKMSKSKGNTVDPFSIIKKYGADALRWYMLANSNPWENLKFNEQGVEETKRKYFGTLYNTYSFFVLYANVDNFAYHAVDFIPVKSRPEIDQWISSELHTLIKNTDAHYTNYEATPVARAIQEFTEEKLSNWYVRRSRRRFWKNAWSDDKIAAYQTLFECLNVLAVLASPIAPFFSDWLYRNLHQNHTKNTENLSVHLADWPKFEKANINKKLEGVMQLAQSCTSLALSIRKKENIRVRQPLSKLLIPAANKTIQEQLKLALELIKEEVNVKTIEISINVSDIIVKSIKPNFKVLGPRFGKVMKDVSQAIGNFTNNQINTIEQKGAIDIKIDGRTETIQLEEVEITFSDIPGWKIASDGNNTVALDITLNKTLIEEGIARDVVNRLQNLRKGKQLEITDNINVLIDTSDEVQSAIMNNLDYICREILANKLEVVDIKDIQNSKQTIELENNQSMAVVLEKADVNISKKKS